MGLGLSITKKIVDAHHGEIIAENLPGGVGARFTIIIPRSLMTRDMRYRAWAGEEGL
jgi:signal transduction histidine kinase